MRLVISFAALFLSVMLLQLSSGGVGPLDALTGLANGFGPGQIGLLGSAHFAGFFIGCWWAPRLMGSIGHSRSFAVFTAFGAIGLIGHTLILNPTAWAALRIASGLCIAGCYTVIEAWLQAKLTNETRGRAMGVYRFADISSSLLAQLMIGFLANVETYLAYNTLALLCCACLLPLTLTRLPPPEMPRAPRLRPILALTRSPLAVSGVIVSGMTAASFRMIGPVYGAEVGLSASQIGYFLALFVAGGAAAQMPAGWLADRYDRRWVLIGLAIISVGACILSAHAASIPAVLWTAIIFGFVTFPVYSVAAAHAHDFARSDERVELSAALMFFFATGAIVAPVLTSQLINSFGAPALFTFIATGHGALAVFGLWRMLQRPTVTKRTRYVYAPRTSFLIGRLLRRTREDKD